MGSNFEDERMYTVNGRNHPTADSYIQPYGDRGKEEVDG